MDDKDFGLLVGKVLTSVKNVNDEEIVFTVEGGEQYKLVHFEDCCESVMVDDICGDLKDLIGSPILRAEESTSDEPPDGFDPEDRGDESETWTFYNMATAKGSVTIRWYGSSNGYYSEDVDFVKV